MNGNGTIHPGLQPLPYTGKWLFWVTACFSVIYVSYSTSVVSFARFYGYFPLRPVIYMLLGCAASLWLTLPKRPLFSRTSLAICALMLWRIVESALNRWPHGEEFLDNIFACGSSMLMVVTLMVGAGVFVRTSTLPLLVASAASVILVSVANHAEAAGLYHHSTVPGRSAGFHGDANDAGIAIVANLAVFLVCCRSYWARVALIGIAGLGVTPTYSRSGMIVLALVVLIFFAQNLRQHARRIGITVAAGVVLASIGGAVLSMRPSAAGGARDDNVESRSSAIFSGDVSKMNSSERMKDLTDGWEAVKQRPLAGYGFGAGHNHWQPHNMLVSVWLDLGFAGALFYTLILISLLVKSLLQRGLALVAVVPVILFVPFSQMLHDHPSTWFGALVAGILTSSRPLAFALFSSRPAGEMPPMALRA